MCSALQNAASVANLLLTPEAVREAKRRILQSLSKGGEDGYISAWLNRPISRRLSTMLVRTPITPNQITVFSFLLSLAGAACLATADHVWWVVGAAAVQLASIVDGCDGEIARLKVMGTARGAWLDTLLDRYADVALALAVTYAFAQQHPESWVWVSGLLSAVGFVLASYVTKEYQLRFGRPFPNNFTNRIKRRDLRVLAVAAGAVLGHPFEALLLVGGFSHMAVFAVLVSGWFQGRDGSSLDS